MKYIDSFFCIILFTLCFISIHVIGQGSTGSTNQTAPSKLRFVVPKRDELSDFVKVTQLSNGTYIFSGFSIEVFRAAAEIAIPPSRSYEFIPFAKNDGTMNGTFDEMLHRVENEDYDGAVGEITILNNRMEFVDFTMPYLDTKIDMLVRVPTRNGESVAVLTPATKIILVLVGLLGSGILVAVVFWIWKLCKCSRGSSSTQSSGSTLGSIMHVRLVIILALMVLLLTIASYVPRQSSSPPTRLVSDIKNLADVKRRGLKVGYRQGAFVRDMLVEKEGFLESQLVEVESEVVLLDKLQKGSQEDGIDALVAGMHHLKLFQEKHCKNFTIVQDFSLKSTGLAFAFSQDQVPSLTKAFSEAIVTLIDRGDMAEIQASTIGDLDNICIDDDGSIAGSTYQDSISLWLPVASAIFVVVLAIAILLAYCAILMKK